jgi:bifunctional UDP-N-acetylglucosamine pyrophosphorylase/glucosamine-1-phosphate N-acetyltransferase
MKSDLPKVAHCVLGVPMVEHVVNAVRLAGIDRVVVVTGFGAEAVESLLADTGVEFAHQHERLGTGHAVMCAMEVTGDLVGPVVVLAGDVPLIRPETVAHLVEAQEATGAACVVLSAVFPDPTGYGRIIRDESGAVTAIVEHRDLAPEQLPIAEGNVGTYCFDGEVLCAHLHRLETSNSQAEYYLTDLVAILVGEGLSVEAVILEDADESHGINSREQLAEVAGLLQRRIDGARGLSSAPTVTGAPDAAVTMGAGAIPCSYDGPGTQDSAAGRAARGRNDEQGDE